MFRFRTPHALRFVRRFTHLKSEEQIFAAFNEMQAYECNWLIWENLWTYMKKHSISENETLDFTAYWISHSKHKGKDGISYDIFRRGCLLMNSGVLDLMRPYIDDFKEEYLEDLNLEEQRAIFQVMKEREDARKLIEESKHL